MHLCSAWHQLGSRDWRTYFPDGFSMHLCGALVLLGLSHSVKYHILQGLSTWLRLFTAWWLHGRHISRESLPLYSVVKVVTGPSHSQRGGHSPLHDWLGQSHIAERLCGMSNCSGHLCKRPELWFPESYPLCFPIDNIS